MLRRANWVKAHEHLILRCKLQSQVLPTGSGKGTKPWNLLRELRQDFYDGPSRRKLLLWRMSIRNTYVFAINKRKSNKTMLLKPRNFISQRNLRMLEEQKKLIQERHRLEQAQMRDRAKERKERTRRLIPRAWYWRKHFHRRLWWNLTNWRNIYAYWQSKFKAIPYDSDCANTPSIFSSDKQNFLDNSGSIAKEICEVWRKQCKQFHVQVVSRELCGIALIRGAFGQPSVPLFLSRKAYLLTTASGGVNACGMCTCLRQMCAFPGKDWRYSIIIIRNIKNANNQPPPRCAKIRKIN